MKFCSECGFSVEIRIPAGDNRERYICSGCDTIHYQNPRIITGTLPIFENKVLLCRRAIEPREGFWTLPAGFMENGESSEQGAVRETWEEAGANVELISLYTVINLPHINQLYLFYRAELSDLNFCAGPESIEVALFEEADIPWDLLAFSSVELTLKHYFNDLANDNFTQHSNVIVV